MGINPNGPYGLGLDVSKQNEITKIVSHCKNWQKICQVYRVSLRGIDTFSRETTLSNLFLLLFEKGAILKGK